MRRLLWLLLLVAMVLYSLIVYGWILEGNANFERQRLEQEKADSLKYSNQLVLWLMDNRIPCGAHELGEAIPGSYFDYTCDDCMLPEPHLDPEDDPNFIENDD